MAQRRQSMAYARLLECIGSRGKVREAAEILKDPGNQHVRAFGSFEEPIG